MFVLFSIWRVLQQLPHVPIVWKQSQNLQCTQRFYPSSAKSAQSAQRNALLSSHRLFFKHHHVWDHPYLVPVRFSTRLVQRLLVLAQAACRLLILPTRLACLHLKLSVACPLPQIHLLLLQLLPLPDLILRHRLP